MNCGVCGKDMTAPDGKASTIGIRLSVKTPRPNTLIESAERDGSEPVLSITMHTEGIASAYRADWLTHMQKQLGPFNFNHEYCACWECWLRSIGFKPDGEQGDAR